MKKALVIIGLLMVTLSTFAQNTAPYHVRYLVETKRFVNIAEYDDTGRTLIFSFYESTSSEGNYFGTIKFYNEDVEGNDPNNVIMFSWEPIDHPVPAIKLNIIRRGADVPPLYYEVEFMEVHDGTTFTFLYNMELNIPEFTLVPTKDGI